jgi:hypothetical protein
VAVRSTSDSCIVLLSDLFSCKHIVVVDRDPMIRKKGRSLPES